MSSLNEEGTILGEENQPGSDDHGDSVTQNPTDSETVTVVSTNDQTQQTSSIPNGEVEGEGDAATGGDSQQITADNTQPTTPPNNNLPPHTHAHSHQHHHIHHDSTGRDRRRKPKFTNDGQGTQSANGVGETGAEGLNTQMMHVGLGPNTSSSTNTPSQSIAPPHHTNGHAPGHYHHHVHVPLPYPVSRTDITALSFPITSFPFMTPEQELAYHKQLIMFQVEYYFSVENLCRDIYLRKHMDSSGWVPLSLVAGFNRIRRLTDKESIVRDAVKYSKIVEVRGMKVRKRRDWGYWLLKKDVASDSSRHIPLVSHDHPPLPSVTHSATSSSSAHPASSSNTNPSSSMFSSSSSTTNAASSGHHHQHSSSDSHASGPSYSNVVTTGALPVHDPESNKNSLQRRGQSGGKGSNNPGTKAAATRHASVPASAANSGSDATPEHRPAQEPRTVTNPRAEQLREATSSHAKNKLAKRPKAASSNKQTSRPPASVCAPPVSSDQPVHHTLPEPDEATPAQDQTPDNSANTSAASETELAVEAGHSAQAPSNPSPASTKLPPLRKHQPNVNSQQLIARKQKQAANAPPKPKLQRTAGRGTGLEDGPGSILAAVPAVTPSPVAAKDKETRPAQPRAVLKEEKREVREKEVERAVDASLATQMLVILQRPVISLLVQPVTPANPRALLRAKKSWKHRIAVWHVVVVLAFVLVAIALYIRYFTNLVPSLRK